jgi:serine/threonine protein kinase
LIDHSGVLKISDFGLSKVRPKPDIAEKDTYTMTGETGSYRFMAPEVYRHEDYNETVDVYSFAMIFFYLLIGRPPWPTLPGLEAVSKAALEGDRPNIPRDVDGRLQALLKECWDDNRRARPSFSRIISTLAVYQKDVYKTDTNDVASLSTETGCGCTIS